LAVRRISHQPFNLVIHVAGLVLDELGHGIASPAEAREMLALKGGDRVAF